MLELVSTKAFLWYSFLVNVYEANEITDPLEVYSFPTMALFKNGKFKGLFPGPGKITKESVLKWVNDAAKLKEGL